MQKREGAKKAETKRRSKQSVTERAKSKDECKVQTLRTLGRERDKEVHAMLEHIAWQVEPIMLKRNWKVNELKELEPENTTRVGDNTNRGQRVRVMCRNRDDSLFPYEKALQTMLHELVHCRIGPHNDDFWQLLDEITQECFDLRWRRTGGTCEGFDAPATGTAGFKAGWGIPSAEVPCDPRDAARKAAEQRTNNRLQERGIVGSSSGASSISVPANPREAACQAAERRKRDKEFAEKHGLLDDVEVIELDNESSEDTGGDDNCQSGVESKEKEENKENEGTSAHRYDKGKHKIENARYATAATKSNSIVHMNVPENEVVVLDMDDEDPQPSASSTAAWPRSSTKRVREEADELEHTKEQKTQQRTNEKVMDAIVDLTDDSVASKSTCDRQPPEEGEWRSDSGSGCRLKFTPYSVECPSCARGIRRASAREHLRKCQRKRRRRHGVPQAEGGDGNA